MSKELTVEKLEEIVKGVIGPEMQEMRTEIKRISDEGPLTNVADVMKDALSRNAPERKKETGSLAIGYARAKAAEYKGGKGETAEGWAAKAYGEDNPVTKALAATSSGSGQELVPQEVAKDVIELLYPATVVRRMGARTVEMDRGKLEMPKLTGGVTATYIDENGVIQASQATTGNINLFAKKLAAITPISMDLIRRADVLPGAQQIFTDDLVQSAAVRQDLGFIRDDGSGVLMTGLRNQPGIGVTASAGTTLAQITDDLKNGQLYLRENNGRMIQPGWLMSPRSFMNLMTVRDGLGHYAFRAEMTAGRLWSHPYAVTTQISTTLGVGADETEIYLIDFADVIIGDSLEVRIDSSEFASYVQSGSTVSAFAQDQLVIRLIQEHDIGLRRSESVHVTTGVQW